MWASRVCVFGGIVQCEDRVCVSGGFCGAAILSAVVPGSCGGVMVRQPEGACPGDRAVRDGCVLVAPVVVARGFS